MKYTLKRHQILNKKENKGFIHIKLLGVIGTLAVLISISLVGYLGIRTYSKNNIVLNELKYAKEVIKKVDQDKTYYYNGNEIVNESNKGKRYYELTFKYDIDNQYQKNVLSYNTISNGTVNNLSSWTTIFKGVFNELNTLSGTFEVETSNGFISSVHYISSDKNINATWIIEDDSIFLGRYKSNSSNDYTSFKVYRKYSDNM